MSEDFFDIVGTTPAEGLPVCEKDGCERRICSADSQSNYRYVLVCCNCFEFCVIDKEEHDKVQRMMRRIEELWVSRRELMKKYGRNKKSYDLMDGYKYGN
jgi:hypothetical protein